MISIKKVSDLFFLYADEEALAFMDFASLKHLSQITSEALGQIAGDGNGKEMVENVILRAQVKFLSSRAPQ